MTSNQTSSDVAIVGGGIIGLLTAYELVNSGAKVTIFDRQSMAKESSWAGGGILSPLYPWRYPDSITALASWSQRQYPILMKELLDQTGIDPEYTVSGLLLFSSDESQDAFHWSEKHNSGLELIDAELVENFQSGLNSGNDKKSQQSQWAWMPGIAQVRNPKLLQALRKYLDLKDVKFVENTSISGFIEKSGRLTGLATNNGNITAGRCLVAAGAWSGVLLSELGVKLPIEPVRGQMLLLKGKPGLLSTMVLKNNHYLIPRLDGRILVGSTLEYEGFDKSVTDSAREELSGVAEEIMPGILQFCDVETQWAGLRPGSPEGIPYIGEHPNVSGLFVSSGHFRNGFVLAPASAKLAAGFISNRALLTGLGVSPENYALNRVLN